MTTRKMILELDEQDYATINAEIARRQASWSALGSVSRTEDDGSCIAGTLIADAIRDLDEYRSMCES